MSASKNGSEGVEPEHVVAYDPQRFAYLAANRSIIVRRSLLATALGSIPVPVVDDYIAGRVLAGLLMRVAEQRKVDLPQGSAELLADPRESSTMRHATITAISLVALRMAWNKFSALLQVSQGAEEMATNFQFATLFDHYCAKLHVGGAVDRKQAYQLRKAMHETVEHMEKAALVSVFRDGARVLGRSLLEAPRWLTNRLGTLAQRWVATRGNAEATFDPAADVAETGETKWLDRATQAVEARLAGLGHDYLAVLIDGFERRWAAAQAAAQTAQTGGDKPPGPAAGSN